MTRGFIKEVDGSMRMRFVKPGYNADDFNTPAEHVIFDSTDLATLSVIHTGEVFLGDGHATGKTVQVASWNFGFVPLCSIHYSFNGEYFTTAAAVVDQDGGDFDRFWTRVAWNGIFMKFRFASNNARFWVRWIAYDLPV